MSELVSDSANRRVVHLSGEVDLEHAPQIRKILMGAVDQGSWVLVDMSEVSYIDSSGIACLIEALQLARKNGADLALVAVNPQAMRVLELARLDTVFAIHPDLTSAVQQSAQA